MAEHTQIKFERVLVIGCQDPTMPSRFYGRGVTFLMPGQVRRLRDLPERLEFAVFYSHGVSKEEYLDIKPLLEVRRVMFMTSTSLVSLEEWLNARLKPPILPGKGDDSIPTEEARSVMEFVFMHAPSGYKFQIKPTVDSLKSRAEEHFGWKINRSSVTTYLAHLRRKRRLQDQAESPATPETFHPKIPSVHERISAKSETVLACFGGKAAGLMSLPAFVERFYDGNKEAEEGRNRYLMTVVEAAKAAGYEDVYPPTVQTYVCTARRKSRTLPHSCQVRSFAVRTSAKVG